MFATLDLALPSIWWTYSIPTNLNKSLIWVRIRFTEPWHTMRALYHWVTGVIHTISTLEMNKFKSRFKVEFLVPNISKFRLFLGGISFIYNHNVVLKLDEWLKLVPICCPCILNGSIYINDDKTTEMNFYRQVHNANTYLDF